MRPVRDDSKGHWDGLEGRVTLIEQRLDALARGQGWTPSPKFGPLPRSKVKVEWPELRVEVDSGC